MPIDIYGSGSGGGGGGTGNVTGPGSSTDNAVVRFNGTTGKLIQNGVVTYDDDGNMVNAMPRVKLDAITDPATNAAVTTAKVDGFGGTVITVTTSANTQTLQSPTDTTAGKTFLAINNDTSSDTVSVNGRSLAAGENLLFVWDGSAWTTEAPQVTTATEQSFTATASQTTFTLSGAASLAFVWVNGLSQEPQDFSVSGTTLTLVNPSVVNDDVKVLFFSEVASYVEANPRSGFADYNDATTSTTAITLTANTWTTITNDGAGAFTNLGYLPTGATDLMDTSTGEFDFSELSIGDVVYIRNDFTVNPSTNNALLELRYQLGTGGSAYTLEKIVGRLDSGSGQDYRFSLTPDMIYIGDTNTRNNPITLQVRLSTNGTLVNAGSAIGVTKR